MKPQHIGDLPGEHTCVDDLTYVRWLFNIRALTREHRCSKRPAKENDKQRRPAFNKERPPLFGHG